MGFPFVFFGPSKVLDNRPAFSKGSCSAYFSVNKSMQSKNDNIHIHTLGVLFPFMSAF